MILLDTENTKERVVKILEKILPNFDFNASSALVDDGILDSFSTVMLVSELSMDFGINFDIEELKPENLNSIDAIVNTVQKLINVKANNA